MRRDPHIGPRAEIYAHFRRFSNPMFTLCTQLPVALPKSEYFGGILWSVLYAANNVSQFLERIEVDGQYWIQCHDTVDTTCTVATEDEAFVFCEIPWLADRAAFLSALPGHMERARARGRLMPEGPPRTNRLYLSCVPWFTIHSAQHAEPGDPNDCVPRILWGRVQDGQIGVCVTAHHSLVDGRHIGQFFQHMGQALMGPFGEQT